MTYLRPPAGLALWPRLAVPCAISTRLGDGTLGERALGIAGPFIGVHSMRVARDPMACPIA